MVGTGLPCNTHCNSGRQWPCRRSTLCHGQPDNGGAHGFSEMLYTYSSCGGNNGSAFAGFNANTVFLNVSLGLVMLFARFLPIIGTLAIAGSLAGKKKIATTAGTMSTTNGMFVFLLIVVVLLIGALSFFPALALVHLLSSLEALRNGGLQI